MVPSKPADAAMVPECEVQIWWQPRLWAPSSSWTRTGGVVRVLYIFIEELPDAVRSCEEMAEREKMSVGCASGCLLAGGRGEREG